MTVTEQIDQQHQEDLQRLRGFRLLDDDFLTKCFEGDPQSIQLVLRIVLEMPDLEVVDVHTQVFVENLLNRSVRLDVFAPPLYQPAEFPRSSCGPRCRLPEHPAAQSG